MATTTSGGPCARTAWPSASAPETPPTSRSSRRGRRRCRRRSAIRSTTGRTWSCSSHSVSANSSTRAQRGRSTTTPRRACRRMASPLSACFSSSAWPRSAPPTIPSIPSASSGPCGTEGSGDARLSDLATRQGPGPRRPGPLERLGRCAGGAGASIGTWGELMNTLERRHAAFHEMGCRASDHGLEHVDAESFTEAELALAFGALRAGRALDAAAAARFRSGASASPGRAGSSAGLGPAVPSGALRNANARLGARWGRTRASSSMGNFDQAAPLGPVPRPPRRGESAGEDHPLQPQPARQRSLRHHDRQLPGRFHPRQDAVRRGLVVPRPERRNGGATPGLVEPRSLLPLRRDDHGLTQLPVLFAARVLPTPGLQSSRERRARRSPS